jgi:hypothetical protein
MGNAQSSSAAEAPAAASAAAAGASAAACPMVGAGAAAPPQGAAAGGDAAAPRCPVPVSARATAIYNVYGQRIDTPPPPGAGGADPLAALRASDVLDPKNNMPLAPNQQPCPGQRRLLSTERMESNIPKGGTDETWVYPSPQMFFNGGARRGRGRGGGWRAVVGAPQAQGLGNPLSIFPLPNPSPQPSSARARATTCARRTWRRSYARTTVCGRMRGAWGRMGPGRAACRPRTDHPCCQRPRMREWQRRHGPCPRMPAPCPQPPPPLPPRSHERGHVEARHGLGGAALRALRLPDAAQV